MAEKKNPLGPTGEYVRENVARLRGRMQYKELSEQLGELGRPIPPLGLRRIEAGERRVDADDLMALAVALGVPPNSLLLPHVDPGEAPPATAVGEVDFQELWHWADGIMPLHGADTETAGQRAERRARSRPAFPGAGSPELRELLDRMETLSHEVQSVAERVRDVGDD
ncbi:helix-turn-helix transcriptional regulator [Arthrobacter sp. AL12]|uniref:helix-turn-helix domain-containing protein n=1 Tax=Arthrobacter sp. AL12 TaxID=3042241 RepID=UPI00249B1E3C|nr:helix-turn-helix transcriptional regulator [Arthrobacter sp. AL12]MDI3210489.1 helix-turn-helix transcriptional regulator [Arthrobacter sp. AL12]